MAFSAIKNKSFIWGLSAGIIVIFSSSFPIIGGVFESVFTFLGELSPFPEGVIGTFINSILLILFIFLVLKLIMVSQISLYIFTRFLYGFTLVWLIFFVFALIAISQFQFGF